MDDLDQIKRLMDPPTRLTAEATQTARGRLLAVATEPSMHRRWRRRGLGLGSPRRRLGVLAISGAALVTVSALALPALTGASTKGGKAPGHGTVRPLGTRILLAAAERVAGTPQTTGRYWMIHLRVGTTHVVGPPNGRYVIEGGDDVRQWAGPQSFQSDRYRGWHPWRPADVAAWRRAGAPATWKLLDHRGGRGITVNSQASGGDVARIPTTITFMVAGRTVSAEQLRRLPTDPLGLRRYLREHRAPDREGPISDVQWLFDDAADLLLDSPAPPKVQAAAYRMLIGLPGIREIGPVNDALNRRGVAVALRSPGNPIERQLIIDPSTGRLLAVQDVVVQPGRKISPWDGERSVGDVLSYRAELEARWSDESPQHL